MNHYTYLLQSKTDDMMYIGVRSCACLPEEDNYWGSSKHLPDNVSEVCDKFILGRFDTRKDAVADEIKRHEINDVVVSDLFWNKAKQTSTGFDTTGVSSWNKGKKMPNATRQKLSESHKGQVVSQETRLKISKGNKNKKVPIESRQKISDSLKARNQANIAKGEKHYMCGRSLSEEHKIKISNSKKGHTVSEEVRAKISATQKGRKQKVLTCPYCSKTGGVSNIKRFHFDNCKHKE